MKKSIFSIILICVFGLVFSQPEQVNVGTSNSGAGDPLRTAFVKVNINDEAAFDSITALNERLKVLEEIAVLSARIVVLQEKQVKRQENKDIGTGIAVILLIIVFAVSYIKLYRNGD